MKRMINIEIIIKFRNNTKMYALNIFKGLRWVFEVRVKWILGSYWIPCRDDWIFSCYSATDSVSITDRSRSISLLGLIPGNKTTSTLLPASIVKSFTLLRDSLCWYITSYDTSLVNFYSESYHKIQTINTGST